MTTDAQPAVNDSSRATGGRIYPHGMQRVDHYDRAQVLMPNGTMMCSYTPVFEKDC